MISLSRNPNHRPPVIRVFGVGGAGCNVIDRLVLDGIEAVSVTAINTDVQALNASVAPDKIHLGQQATRGLGTGGDPEIGYTAAEESAGELESAVAGADLVFIVTGLGGGTGSGATPLVAHYARRAGAMVVVFATMPFTFEGRRRGVQAAEALEQIKEQSNLLMCFENDRMGEASSPTAGVQQAFIAADHIVSSAIRALVAMVRGHGLISVGLDHLAVALRQRDSRCLFGHGESDGANRAHEALDRAFKSPLLEKGRVLSDSHTILIHVTAGPDITLNEVTVLMEDFQRQVSDTTLVQFGLTTDSRLGRKLAVTILSSTSARAIAASAAHDHSAVASVVTMPPVKPAPAPTPAPVPAAAKPTPAPISVPVPAPAPAAAVPETLFTLDPEPEPERKPAPASAAEPAVAAVREEKRTTTTRQPATAKASPKPAAEPTGKKEQKAEQMPLEAPSRGRFDKGEPTIVDGQDLDVPTFLRRNVKLK